MNLIKFILKISLSGTLFYALTFYSYIIRTKIKIGYFPYMNNPDIVKSTSGSHYDFTVIMFAVMILTYVLSLVLYLFNTVDIFKRMECLPSIVVHERPIPRFIRGDQWNEEFLPIVRDRRYIDSEFTY